jgi:hypothetical protein
MLWFGRLGVTQPADTVDLETGVSYDLILSRNQVAAEASSMAPSATDIMSQ